MRNCGFTIYESCNCGSQCKSATIPLDEYTDEDRTLNTVLAKSRAWVFAKYGASVVFALAIISLSFVYAAMPESNRMAKFNQERNVTWR
jgi:hypothetical protein